MKLNIQLFADGDITITTKLDTKSFDAQITKLEDELAHYDAMYEKYASAGRKLTMQEEEDFEKLKVKIEQTSNKLLDMYKKKELMNQKDTFGGMSSGLSDIIKKVGKWTIAIFGIRSAYSFVRQAISTLSSNNKQLAKDIENIRYGLASALQPVIQKIVQWAYKLMQAINYIWKIMTGKNLFSNMKKDLNASNKSAQKLQKTIAGFDEMNTLNDNSGSGSGGSGGAGFTEDLTATNLLTEEQKKKLEEIAGVLKDIYETILKPIWDGVLKPIGEWLIKNPKILTGLLTTIVGFKIGSKIAGLTGIIGTGSGGLIGALALLDIYLVSKVVKDIKNELIPTIKETNKKIEEAKSLAEGTTTTTKKLNNETIEYSKSVDAGDKALSRNIDFMLKKIQTTDKEIQAEKDQINVKGLLTGENKVHQKVIEELDNQMWENINTLGKLAESQKLTGKEAQNFVDTCQREIEKLESKNNTLDKTSVEYKKNKEKIEELKAQIDKTKGNYNVNVNTKADKTKVDELKNAVDSVSKNHKGSIDIDTSKGKKSVGNFFKDLGENVATTLGFNWSSLKKKFGFAKGGIINQPGRGIPLATAVGGERGAEGVIPLTDSQQMALLGEAIGKYITINASITNTMNGRVISRELQKVRSENSFTNNW